MNGLLFHLVGPHHYAQMTALLSGEEMRQGPVYLQCADDDDDHSKAIFVLEPWRRNCSYSFPSSSCPAIWPWRYYYYYYFLSVCL